MIIGENAAIASANSCRLSSSSLHIVMAPSSSLRAVAYFGFHGAHFEGSSFLAFRESLNVEAIRLEDHKINSSSIDIIVKATVINAPHDVEAIIPTLEASTAFAGNRRDASLRPLQVVNQVVLIRLIEINPQHVVDMGRVIIQSQHPSPDLLSQVPLLRPEEVQFAINDAMRIVNPH